MLPERLKKLTWGSQHDIQLPSSLRELRLCVDVRLTLPEGLLKIDFGWTRITYDLPESVQEVTWAIMNEFTHPSTLQHLIIRYHGEEVDLSQYRIHRVTLQCSDARIKKWPLDVKELEFTVDDVQHPVPILPEGCRIVGERPPLLFIEA